MNPPVKCGLRAIAVELLLVCLSSMAICVTYFESALDGTHVSVVAPTADTSGPVIPGDRQRETQGQRFRTGMPLLVSSWRNYKL